MGMVNQESVSAYLQSRLSARHVMLIFLGSLVALALLILLGSATILLVLGHAQTPKTPADSAVAPAIVVSNPTLTTSPHRELSVDGYDFVWCPPGKFTMGSSLRDTQRNDDERAHDVTLTTGFWMGRHEVTQAQWESVMGYNPSKFPGPQNPVENVSWDDCAIFIRTLNVQSGKHFRLPTEAEWEYTCRAGSSDLISIDGVRADLGACATYGLNSGGTTSPVGNKLPNAWGLHDMHGNVWEWCADWLGAYPDSAAVDPRGPATGNSRIIRGGSWNGSPANCRPTNRNSRKPDTREEITGFRLVLDAPHDVPVLTQGT